MVKTRWSSSATALSLLLNTFYAPTVSAIQTISAVGSKFFYEDGTQYYIKGACVHSTHDSSSRTDPRAMV